MKYFIFISALILSTCSVSFAAQDSTAKASASTVQKAPVNPAKPSSSQALEEEDILVDEAEAKKIIPLAADTAERKRPSSPSGTDYLQPIPKSVDADSQKNNGQVAEQKAESAAVVASTDTAVAPNVNKPDSVKAPAAIESIRSINFAKNLKDYRSPKLAMLLSLIVPGLGQAYVKRYYKTGVFVAIEATAIGFSVAFNNKGKQKYTDAKTIADNNYQYDKMIGYYNGLRNFIKTLSQNENNPDSAMEAKIFDIFMDSSLVGFKQSYQSTPRSQEFYRAIELNTFVQGWKDCRPDSSFTLNPSSSDTIFADGFKYRKNDTLRYKVGRIDTATGKIVGDSSVYGYSAKQIEFTQAVSKSNSYYKTAQNILFSMVINHVLSAVDALISAKAYNDGLIGKESVWRHISVEQQMVDAGSRSVPGCALKFRF